MNTKLLADILGYTAATIGAAMFVPQVITLWKTKETKGVSLVSFSLLAFVSALWLAYGILLEAMPVILVNAALLVLSSIIVFLKLRYK